MDDDKIRALSEELVEERRRRDAKKLGLGVPVWVYPGALLLPVLAAVAAVLLYGSAR